MGDNDLDERRKRCAELQAKYPEGLLPPCHIDHDAMCRDHTLAVLRKLREKISQLDPDIRDTKTSPYRDGYNDGVFETCVTIDEAIRNEEKA